MVFREYIFAFSVQPVRVFLHYLFHPMRVFIELWTYTPQLFEASVQRVFLFCSHHPQSRWDVDHDILRMLTWDV